MNPNRGLLSCDAVLARLDAALELAASEVECGSIAEKRLGMMVSRLSGDYESRDAEISVIRFAECSSKPPANENLEPDHESVFEILQSPFSGLGDDYRFAKAL